MEEGHYSTSMYFSLGKENFPKMTQLQKEVHILIFRIKYSGLMVWWGNSTATKSLDKVNC